MLLLSLSVAVMSVRWVRRRPGAGHARSRGSAPNSGAGAVRFEAGTEQRNVMGGAQKWVVPRAELSKGGSGEGECSFEPKARGAVANR